MNPQAIHHRSAILPPAPASQVSTARPKSSPYPLTYLPTFMEPRESQPCEKLIKNDIRFSRPPGKIWREYQIHACLPYLDMLWRLEVIYG
jgi:hypothetical protein